jgi:hypothetical protein
MVSSLVVIGREVRSCQSGVRELAYVFWLVVANIPIYVLNRIIHVMFSFLWSGGGVSETYTYVSGTILQSQKPLVVGVSRTYFGSVGR